MTKSGKIIEWIKSKFYKRQERLDKKFFKIYKRYLISLKKCLEKEYFSVCRDIIDDLTIFYNKVNSLKIINFEEFEGHLPLHGPYNIKRKFGIVMKEYGIMIIFEALHSKEHGSYKHAKANYEAYIEKLIELIEICIGIVDIKLSF